MEEGFLFSFNKNNRNASIILVGKKKLPNNTLLIVWELLCVATKKTKFIVFYSILMSPLRYSLACPLISTLSPDNLHCKYPLRSDSCTADRFSLFNFLVQYGVKVVCAEPVTGSSIIPD